MALMTQYLWDVALPVTAIAFVLGIVLVNVLFSNRSRAVAWEHLDIVGVESKTSQLSWLRAILTSPATTARRVQHGYSAFCRRKSLPFAIPSIWTGGAVVVLPPSLLHLLNRPDSELAAVPAQLASIQLPYMFKDPDIYENVIHFDAVRRIMSQKNLDAMAADASEEIEAAFRHYWDSQLKEGEWTTMNNWDACGSVVTRIAMRSLIGAPLCRDEKLLRLLECHGNAVLLGTVGINCMPPFLRPWLGPLVGLRAKYYQAQCLKIMVPFIENKIRIQGHMRNDAEAPVDFLQALIARCAKAGPDQMAPSKIALRILALSTMSFMGMAYVFAHIVLDMYGSPSRDDFVSGLEAECRQVSEANGGLGCKDAVASLYRVESALRESMRFSDFSATNLSRDVAADEFDVGNGVMLPKGVRVVFPTLSIHHDSAFYDNASQYDAFRFSRQFEGPKDEVEKQKGERDSITANNKSFLAFGYGRHACPGRWYAAQVLKQMLAYLVLNYDIEVIDKRPTRQAILNIILPPTEMKIRVRHK
ncbi:hypothetical protein S7711_03114 [Stachybotrys chartarum IBT 7711]|uniref:Cytochrome P450 n=1 Tax=Stachybotrys chartarum (strain CBS 109288 / IBT 7711) TaxID=1280523 RepID=A0A084B8D6_STACB|nr:hypothetical protein S7711_03114 [Stachybotrys chartarum IBT 7711]